MYGGIGDIWWGYRRRRETDGVNQTGAIVGIVIIWLRKNWRVRLVSPEKRFFDFVGS